MKLKSIGIVIIGFVAFIVHSCNHQSEPVPQEDSIYGSWQLVGGGLYERPGRDRIETNVSNGYKVTFRENGELIANCANADKGGTNGPCWVSNSEKETGTFILQDSKFIEITMDELFERSDGQLIEFKGKYDYFFEGQYLFIHMIGHDNGSFDKFVRIELQNYKD